VTPSAQPQQALNETPPAWPVERFAPLTAGDLALSIVLAGLAISVVVSISEPGFVDAFWADEFLLPWYGKQVVNDRVPYLDFFMFLGPLAAYGPALLVKLAGTAIVPFRIVNIILTAVATAALFGIARRRGASRAASFTIAALYPVIIVPLWPNFSHQWTAVTFGLAAVWICHSRFNRDARGLLAGFLASLAGLTVQTIGVITLPLVIASLFANDRTRSARMLAFVGMGVAVPALGCAALLVYHGAFRAFLEHAVLWSVQSYQQAGGYNSGNLRVLLRHHIEQTSLGLAFPGSDALALVLFLPLGLLAFVVPLFNLFSVFRIDSRRRRTIGHLAVVCLALLVFEAGRSDVAHLAYVSPVFLIILAQYVHSGDRPARLLRAFLVTALMIGLLRWGLVWKDQPPRPAAVLRGDDYTSKIVTRLLDEIPGARESRLPVVFLARVAGAFYFYWSPLHPPVDWLGPPSWGVNTPDQYARIAQFVRANRVPYVVVGSSEVLLLRDPSPILDVIKRDYRFDRKIRDGWVYVPAE
jgi:hypothetical protein